MGHRIIYADCYTLVVVSIMSAIDQVTMGTQDELIAMNSAMQLGYELDKLTEPEFNKWLMYFKRSILEEGEFRSHADLYYRHLGDFLFGAMIAKAQLKAKFDGSSPRPGMFGITPLRANYFGLGDDWDVFYTWTAGSPQDWIHSGTTELGGTSGNPIKILEDVVHVIIGIEDWAPLQSSYPVLESVKFTIDGKEKPIIIVRDAFMGRANPRIELDEAYFLRKNTTFLAQVFSASTPVKETPKLIGLTYIKEEHMRTHDPASLDGANKGVVTTV